MGNCMETCRQEVEIKEQEQQEEIRGEKEKPGGFPTGGTRIKIVLRKEELEWLLFQLKDKRGKKKLGDVLGEIERGRSEKVSGWKPSLESIVETPEVVEICR
ncbi:hypothetical protein U1Q18_019776 [Sarracenia purpurea var. burkii]